MKSYVFRTADRQTFLARLAPVVPLVDDDRGLRTVRAGEAEFCPWLETAEGSFVVTVRLTTEEATLVPEPVPEFLIDYDSEGDWPLYAMADGSVQGAGVIV